jgi:photosystem II stability/assembly factor-like uncharacterized protein
MYAVVSNNAGTDQSLFRSSDGGQTWFQSAFSLSGESLLSSIAVDPRNPSTIYAGTGPRTTGTLGYFSLSKSIDGGMNWIKVRGPDTVTDSYGPDDPVVVLDPLNSNTIYFAEDDIWSKSTDGGASWTEMPACGYYTLLIYPLNASTLYAQGFNSVCRSTDGGATWTTLSSGLTGDVNSLTIDPRNPHTVYATTLTGLFVIDLSAGKSRPR